MQFYTYDYIVQRSQFNDIALYVLSFLALIALLFATFKYFRNRLVTRYRDLIVIFVLAVAFLGGTQWNSFNQTKAEEIHTNSTHLKQGMLVEVQGKYYEILFNSDFTSFKYEETHLMTRDVKVVDKDS